MHPTQTVEQVKTDLLAGVRAPACSECWKLEDSGQQSRRQQQNSFLDFRFNRDIDLIEQDCRNGLASPVLYQITVSNICNQACVSCMSVSSTKWAEISRRMGNKAWPTFEINVANEDIDYKNAQRIGILGGEPFFDSKTFDILQNLIDSNNTECFISIITNGSITPNSEQLQILKQFEHLDICVSVDGIGLVFEYMRWPGKWPTLLQNLEIYKSFAKTVSISYTLGAVNVLYHQQTIDWFARNNLNYSYNIVTFPPWQAPISMPVELKNHLPDDPMFVPWKQITGNEQSLTEFSEKLVQQDRAKRISVRNYMPELADILSIQ